MKLSTFSSSCVLCLLLVVGSALGQGGARLVPTGDLPEWIRPGTRLTYLSGGRTAPQGQNKGMAGMGYAHLDIVAVTSEGVLVHTWMSLLPGGVPGGPSSHSQSSGSIVDRLTGGGYWQTTAGLEALVAAGARRGPYLHQGRQVAAVHHVVDADDSRTTRIYDAKTGVLLYDGYGRGERNRFGAIDVPKSKQTGFSQLMAVRRLSLPWAGAPIPPALRDVRSLAYTGTMSVHVGGFTTSLQVRNTVTVTRRGARWVEARVDTTMGAPGVPPTQAQANVVGADHQLCGLWIDPASVRRLRQGQLIDRDPTTGHEVRVMDTSGGYVTIRLATSSNWIDHTYEKSSGLLVGLRRHDPELNRVLQLRLSGRG